jgi:hypothetical protein
MTVARFPVTGTLDGAGGRQSGAVLIDRDSGDFSVRPRGRRRLYTMPLSVVASMVCSAIIRSELAEKKALKKARRAGRSR